MVLNYMHSKLCTCYNKYKVRLTRLVWDYRFYCGVYMLALALLLVLQVQFSIPWLQFLLVLVALMCT
jgi:hypothetical protein